jgi:hypothetical protein
MKGFSTVAKVLIAILALLTIASIVNLCYSIAEGKEILMPIGITLAASAVTGFTINTAIKEKNRKESEEAVDEDSYDDEDDDY